MSFEDATAALEGSIQEDNGATAPTPGIDPVEQAVPAPTTPEGETPAPQVQPDTRERDPLTGRFIQPQVEAPAVEDTFDGGTFNPDQLAPELQPAWKQLQAAYTQKTQKIAEREQQLAQFGDLTQIQQAVELHRTLQDPQTLVQFHSELSRALEQQGLTPAQASVAATQQIEQAQTPPGAQDGLAAQLREQYPELAPLADLVQQQQARLDQFEAGQSERLQAEQLAYTQMAMAGELQRQEMAIRQSNPAYEQGDIDAVYELSAFFDGNLLEAQQRYEQIGNALLGRYLASKSAPVGATPASGTNVVSEQPVTPDDLNQALRASLTHLSERGIDTIG